MSSIRLFDVNDADGYKVMLNKEWIMLIPAFANLIKKDKGGKVQGDYRGDKKAWATRQFTYIYHYTDPRSPLENADVVDDLERRKKSLEYAELTEKDIQDLEFIVALEEYEYLLELAIPSLPLLRSAKGTMKKLKNYFDGIDFDERDNKGALVHSASAHIKNVKEMKSLHLAIKEFDTMVMEELKQSTGIRGAAVMGDREAGKRRRQEWSEGGVAAAIPTEDYIEDHTDHPDWEEF